MKRALTLTTAMIVALALPAMAENVPGAHFIENWDLDESGGVTLEEARERRDDIFSAFDADEDGIMNDEEYDMFDAAREADMKEHGIGQGMGQGGNGQGQGQNQGQGQKQGQGQGKGHGQGHGQGGGMGGHSAAMAMTRQNADTNGDDTVTREEFVAGTDAWFVKQDRNGDGTITAEDFGRGN